MVFNSTLNIKDVSLYCLYTNYTFGNILIIHGALLRLRSIASNAFRNPNYMLRSDVKLFAVDAYVTLFGDFVLDLY